MDAIDGSGNGERLTALLDEVIANGAPAQRERARELRARLDGREASAELESQALALVDAYRNDPYLWR